MSSDSTPAPEAKPASRAWVGEVWKIALAAVLGGVCTAFATLWINEKNPHLTVTTTDTVRFEGEGNKVAIANVTIVNDGSKEAKAVECNLPNVTPTEVIVTPLHLNHSFDIKGGVGGNNLKVIVPTLNPKETVSITVLSTQGQMPDRLEPAVRAEGIVGEPPAQSGWSWTWVWVVCSGLVGLGVGAYVSWGITNAIWQGTKDAVMSLHFEEVKVSDDPVRVYLKKQGEVGSTK